MITWGPFTPGLDAGERKARARALRLALKLLCGERGRAAGLALLRAEISGDDPELFAEAEDEFDRLGTLDQRRVLASYLEVA